MVWFSEGVRQILGAIPEPPLSKLCVENEERIGLSNSTACPCALTQGTWCSGITSAPHAEGPGFNPQCVHILSEIVLANLTMVHMNCRRA